MLSKAQEAAAARAAAEAERERAREARRAELRRQIADRRNKINRLNQYKSDFTRECSKIEENVLTPSMCYDLTASYDIAHWTGDLQVQGEAKKKNLENKISSYMDEIADVVVKINGVINRLESEIASLERELASV